MGVPRRVGGVSGVNLEHDPKAACDSIFWCFFKEIRKIA